MDAKVTTITPTETTTLALAKRQALKANNEAQRIYVALLPVNIELGCRGFETTTFSLAQYIRI